MDLFDKDNILFPEWLSNTEISDDWNNSTYSFENGYHSWVLKDMWGTARICFNGKEYHFQALNEDNEWVLVETITKEDVIRY
jgi:hypothetical protein